MELAPSHRQKADPLLQDALARASGDDVVRAVLVLGDDDIRARDQSPDLDPAQFSSREAYRAALVAARQRQLAAALGPTLQQLEALSLRPKGGVSSRVVVVEGQARQILAALELPGLQHASLDREVR